MMWMAGMFVVAVISWSPVLYHKIDSTFGIKVFLYYTGGFFFSLLLILGSIAFFTLLERKKLAAIQSRRGPNKIAKFGFLQPVVDGIKLVLKETIAPRNSFKVVFFMCSVYAFFIGLSMWIVFPFSYTFINSNLSYGVLFVFVLSVLHVYSVILAGWSSNSHYSFLGAMRCSAQLIAYDITMVIVLLHIFVYTKSLNILKIAKFQSDNLWFFFPFPFIFLIFFVCALAETNRHPFDLPEAEAELVSGYNVEYSGMSFSLFFLGEYSSLIFMSAFTVNFFFGGWDMFGLFSNQNILILKFFSSLFYFLKIWFFCYMFVYVRGLIPRYRYDQLMKIGWKYMLPFTFTSLMYNIIIAYFFGI